MRIALLAVFALVTGCAASAQTQRVEKTPNYSDAEVRHDHLERAQDKQELRADAWRRADDGRDVRDLRQLKAQFEQARSSGSAEKLATAQRAVVAHVDRELRETDREMVQAHAEVRRDHRELSSDRREVRRDVVQDRPRSQIRDDVRDRNDDVRDLRDEQRDRLHERIAHDKLVHLRGDLVALNGKTDPQSLDRFGVLLNELIGLASRERRSNFAERREDLGELREDRKETREDRRQN